MSSHHIVKEGQEPALIIANGEVCSNKLIGELLEWSPYIIVLDGALDTVLSLGIHFDVLLGDFDNCTIEELSQKVPPKTEIKHTPNQDKTDLEKAIEFLIEKKYEAVNILWATGKRGFKKHFNKGDNLSLMPLNTVKNITTTNLVWNLNNQTLEFPYATSSSNKILESDFVNITFSEGFLLAMECHDDKNE